MNTLWKKIITGKLGLYRLLRLAALIYLSILGFAVFYADNLLFPYNESSYDKHLKGLQFLHRPNQKLAIRFWPSNTESYLILYFHGNAEDVGQLSPISDKLNQHGFSVLSMDYRGYGLSDGKPSEQACYDDAKALYGKALRMGYRPEKIIIWGRSIGSGPAVDLALHKKAAALVLESPFTSAFRVMSKYPILPFDKFNNIQKISHINKPLFIIHGNNDTLIPPWHSKKLYDQHKEIKQRHLIVNAGHNNLWYFPLDKTLKALNDFIKSPHTYTKH